MDAKTYKNVLENLIKNAAADGYDLYVEVDGYAEEDRHQGARFELDAVTMTFSNQVAFKKNGGELDYATVDESLYFVDRA